MLHRRRASSRWKPTFALCALLLVLGVALHSTGGIYPSGPPVWYLERIGRAFEDKSSPPALCWRAWYHFEHQNFELATADLREAIERNPGDLGKTYTATSTRELSPEALAHGEQQIRQMLLDRPQMASHIEPGDELWTWAVRKFAGEDVGKYVYWNSSDPSPFYADSDEGENGPAAIRVRPFAADNHPTGTDPFDFMWSSAVFELHNVIADVDSDQLHGPGTTSRLTREQYIIACIDSENGAVERTRAFFADFYLPYAVKKRLPTQPSHWQVFVFFASEQDKLTYYRELKHWPYYGAYYDFIKIHEAFGNHNLATVENVLRQMQPTIADLGATVTSEWHYWQGYLRLHQERFEDAIAEFNRALAIDSGSLPANSLLGRAHALLALGRDDEACRDLNRVVEFPTCNQDVRYDALIGQAYIEGRRGQRSAALDHLETALQLMADRPEAYERRVAIYYDSGDYAAAEADLNELLRIDPHSVTALRGRAHMYGAQEKYREALADLNAALEQTPDDATLYALRGWARTGLQQFHLATADFTRALKLDPDSANALAGRGFLALQWEAQPDRNLQHARDDLFRACELTGWQHPDYVSTLAEVCQKRGDAKEAEEYREKVRQLEQAAQKKAA